MEKEHTILHCWCHKKIIDKSFWKQEELANKEMNNKEEDQWHYQQDLPKDLTPPF